MDGRVHSDAVELVALLVLVLGVFLAGALVGRFGWARVGGSRHAGGHGATGRTWAADRLGGRRPGGLALVHEGVIGHDRYRTAAALPRATECGPDLDLAVPASAAEMLGHALGTVLDGPTGRYYESAVRYLDARRPSPGPRA